MNVLGKNTKKETLYICDGPIRGCTDCGVSLRVIQKPGQGFRIRLSARGKCLLGNGVI